MTQKALTRAATANTTTAPIELESAMELLAAFIPQQLQQGHTVNVPGMGTFRLTFKSDGVEDINKFNAGQMLKIAKTAVNIYHHFDELSIDNALNLLVEFGFEQEAFLEAKGEISI